MPSFADGLDSDLTEVFFKEGTGSEFAEEFTYRPGGVSADDYSIPGIVDMTSETPQPQGNGYATVQTKFIRVMLKEADLEDEPAYGDRVVVRELEYSVVEINSDGVGVITLILQRT